MRNSYLISARELFFLSFPLKSKHAVCNAITPRICYIDASYLEKHIQTDVALLPDELYTITLGILPERHAKLPYV